MAGMEPNKQKTEELSRQLQDNFVCFTFYWIKWSVTNLLPQNIHESYEHDQQLQYWAHWRGTLYTVEVDADYNRMSIWGSTVQKQLFELVWNIIT